MTGTIDGGRSGRKESPINPFAKNWTILTHLMKSMQPVALTGLRNWQICQPLPQTLGSPACYLVLSVLALNKYVAA